MQTLHCEKFKLLFTDALEDELTSASRESFSVHLKECEECSSSYKDFEKLSDIIRNTPVAHIPEGYHFNASAIAAVGKRTKRRRSNKQWLSVAAVFLVFLGSYIMMGDLGLNSPKEQGSMNVAQDLDTLSDGSLDVAECQQRTGVEELYLEAFQEALSEPTFAEEIERSDLGFGYELLQYDQEKDGSVTFVIYFYEDETRTLKVSEEPIDFLSLSNVRSFHWKKIE